MSLSSARAAHTPSRKRSKSAKRRPPKKASRKKASKPKAPAPAAPSRLTRQEALRFYETCRNLKTNQALLYPVQPKSDTEFRQAIQRCRSALYRGDAGRCNVRAHNGRIVVSKGEPLSFL